MVAAGCAILGCDTDPAERRSSIYRLKAEPTPDNVGTIRVLLEDADRDVRATALNALVELDVPDAEALAIAGLDDRDGFVRATAARLLGELGRSASDQVLAGVLLEDPDPVARQRAAEALAQLGGQRALEALTQALADPEERVRRAAIDGLVDLGPAFARDELAELLDADPVWEIRAQAAHALGLTGAEEVLPALEKAAQDDNEFVRSAATNALSVYEKVRDAHKHARDGQE